MGKVTLYLVRHGKTMLNTATRLQGWADSPLTAEGREIAEYVARGLKGESFIAAYSSDSGRAIETAKIILAGSEHEHLTLEQRVDLREWNFGKYEGELSQHFWQSVADKLGTPRDEVFQKIQLQGLADTIASLDDTHQAEDWQTIKGRLSSELKHIAETVEAQGGGNVLIVSHGLTINTLIAIIDESKIRHGLENASVTKISYEHGQFTIEAVGDTTYIERGKNLVHP